MSGRPARLNASEITQYLLANPTITAQEAGDYFKCHPETVKVIARKHDIMKGWFKKERATDV